MWLPATPARPPAAFQDANGPFDVRPFALRVGTTVTAATTRAGEDFTVTLTPVTWDPADDVDDDGIADGHEMGDQDPSDNADLSVGNADIVNFRPVGTARLGSYLHRPSGAPASAGRHGQRHHDGA